MPFPNGQFVRWQNSISTRSMLKEINRRIEKVDMGIITYNQINSPSEKQETSA